ncbi:hypothetical protein K437DRAFT_220774 [Tilletiaria anomala UBC 951]|uniref:Inositol-1-monophosphatase n=1 Tax=Tilletiaria anomala (strain ATCC 24038 / CBS 436.72 / UBC 951) TaxID=1037660 RepID=A0A066WN15_TILAU|nr:uncharacterized protein K437DRAFT_220774 [Tilletiaria anomala UBC 951]KDN52359.1 hypothetical protein K437DRAFT_220774 [Tilletiaria anomala UBC 951]
MSELNLQEVLDFAIDLAKKAGKAISDGQAKRFTEGTAAETKKNSADLLTEVDQATEKLVKEAITAKYPDHAFIGEESAQGSESVPEGGCWIVDPIDGTTNFVHGFPYCCISIGFTYKKEPVMGVIYAPFLDHLYYALQGHGAYLVTAQAPEPRRLPLAKPTPLPSMRQAVVAMEWGSDRRSEILEAKLQSFRRLCGDPEDVEGGKMVQGIRSIGSAALVSASIAAGSIDVYYEIGTWSWDQCAGTAILREAGGVTVGSKAWTSKALASDSMFGTVPPEVLMGRKYLSIRAIGDTPQESGRAAQKRLIKEFYDAVVEFDPK